MVMLLLGLALPCGDAVAEVGIPCGDAVAGVGITMW